MTPASLSGRKILLIVGGGIAAYKALELVRLLRKAGAEVMSVLTAAGAEFVTPMSLAALWLWRAQWAPRVRFLNPWAR
jgi:phosphopantothenoylcysteine decarboxylase/phosphopantothenate--cysteine ligase